MKFVCAEPAAELKCGQFPACGGSNAKDLLVDRNSLFGGMVGECGACTTNRQNRSRSGGIGRVSRDLGNQRGNRSGTEAGADRQVRGGCGQRRGLPDSGEWLVRGLLPRAEKLRPSVRIWRQTFCARPGQFPERDEYGSRGFGKGRRGPADFLLRKGPG